MDGHLDWDARLVVSSILLSGETMANLSIPLEERSMTPQQIDALELRRRKGALLLTIAGQFTVISVLLCAWAGSDLVWSPGWAKPMDIYRAGSRHFRRGDAPRCARVLRARTAAAASIFSPFLLASAYA
jgi:hypothetical protein